MEDQRVSLEMEKIKNSDLKRLVVDLEVEVQAVQRERDEAHKVTQSCRGWVAEPFVLSCNLSLSAAPVP